MTRLLAHFASALLAAPLLLAQPATPELPPIPASPIEQFRQWLTMSEADRDTALATWPAEKQAVLKRKIEVYARLPLEERERRLTMLELRHFLRPLMQMPPADRTNQLSAVPERLRDLIALRLERWDKLSPALQKQVLEHDAALSYFSRVPPPPMPSISPRDLPPQPSAVSPALSNWMRLSESERREISSRLAEFFELPPARQEKTLETLSDMEREEIQKTLSAFASLPPQQKRACIDSFGKFANMAPRERNEFLRNAARWQAMSPEERQTWKRLVQTLPPMPPEVPSFPPFPRIPSALTNR